MSARDEKTHEAVLKTIASEAPPDRVLWEKRSELKFQEWFSSDRIVIWLDRFSREVLDPGTTI